MAAVWWSKTVDTESLLRVRITHMQKYQTAQRAGKHRADDHARRGNEV